MTALLDFYSADCVFYRFKTTRYTGWCWRVVGHYRVGVYYSFYQAKRQTTKTAVGNAGIDGRFLWIKRLFHDDTFLKWKSTVINGIFAAALLISVVLGKPLLQLVMKNVFKLTSKGWNYLTLAWAGYFILMAVLQYYFAFFTSNDTWINFKTWGGMPIMLGFLVGQFMFLKNHLKPQLTAATSR